MSSCSPSSSSALQDESSSSSRETARKILRIRFVMKRPEVEPEPNTEERVHSCAKESVPRDSEKFTGRRDRKRKQSAPDMTQLEADTSNGDVEASTLTATKEKTVMSPISGGETHSTPFMASARNAVEQEATRSHMTCKNKKVKSVTTNEGPKTHKCKSCPAAFATGQELGGHMRAHYKGTISISASSSSKRAKGKGKGIIQAGSSSGTARNKAPVGSSSESIKDKDSNASSTTEAPTKNTAAASSRSVTRELFVPLALDLNELPVDQEGEKQLIVDEDQKASPLDLTLSL